MALIQKSFSDLITFTRASGGGRFNASGQYEWLPANQPRIDYDPVTGECRGLLVEEQRTNLLTYSNEFGNSAWIKGGSVVEAGVGLAPDGSAAATKLVESTANSTHRLTRNVSGANGAYSLSLRVRPAGRTRMRLYLSDNVSSVCFAHFDLTTGQVFSTEFGAKWTGGAASIKPIGGGWFECALSATSTDTTSAGKQLVIDLYDGTSVSYQGDGTSGVYIWGAQLEAGTFPTSLVHTTDAQVTRAADVASVNTLSPWYNPEQGTLFVEAVPLQRPDEASLGTLASLRKATTWEGYRVIPDKDRAKVIARDVDGPDASIFLPGRQLSPKQALAFVSGESVSLAAGGSVASVDYTDVPEVSNLTIGYGAGGLWLNGHIRSLRFYPRRLSNTELQAVTA